MSGGLLQSTRFVEDSLAVSPQLSKLVRNVPIVNSLEMSPF
jgi:hypothetical protein